MALSAVEVGRYAPRFQIGINGSRLSAEVSHTVLSLRVEQTLNTTNTFTFEVQDEFRDQQFKWLGHDLFKYGNEISVALGYSQRLTEVLEGRITELEPRFTGSTAPTFTVSGADRAYDFLRTPSDTRVFRNKTDSEIVRTICRMAGLTASVDDTTETHPIRVKQGGRTYFEFLQQLARESGFHFQLAGRRLHFRRGTPNTAAVGNLNWGQDLISFNPRLSLQNAVSAVVVRGWDPINKERVEARVEAGEETAQEPGRQLASEIADEIYGEVVRVVTRRTVRSVAEARRLALSELESASASLITGTAETIGQPTLEPGVYLDMNGLGNWFSGKYFVEGLTHTFDQSGFRTTLQLKRNAL